VRNALNRSYAVCWQCGGAAEPEAAYHVGLVASTSRALSPLGFPVTRQGWQDSVRVPIPRCRTCRTRNRGTAVTILIATVSGALVLPALRSAFRQADGSPPWWLGCDTPDHIMTGVGMILGFLIAVLGIAVHKRRLGLRSLNSYPPVVALRRSGWQWPGD